MNREVSAASENDKSPHHKGMRGLFAAMFYGCLQTAGKKSITAFFLHEPSQHSVTGLRRSTIIDS